MAVSWTYVYDDLYRLTSETVMDATLGNGSTSWSYDAVGNRLTEPGGSCIGGLLPMPGRKS